MSSTTPSPPADDVPEVRRLGVIDYEEALALQHDLVARRARDEIPDLLLLCEHPSVVTLGRGGKPSDVLDRRFPVVEIERGGEATYHGPGQLVGYWIRLLRTGRRDLRAHLRRLETLLVAAAADLEVVGRQVEGATGLWTDTPQGCRKLASIGVAARNWVTFHGFALNADVDLEAFRSIVPCGFDASVMTSLSTVAGKNIGVAEAADAVVEALRKSRDPA